MDNGCAMYGGETSTGCPARQSYNSRHAWNEVSGCNVVKLLTHRSELICGGFSVGLSVAELESTAEAPDSVNQILFIP